MRELQLGEPPIRAAFARDQFFVRTAFRHRAGFDHVNSVALADGREPVCDDEGGAIFEQRSEGALDELLALAVE